MTTAIFDVREMNAHLGKSTMKALIKIMIVFWGIVVPLAIAALIFAPMFAKPLPAYQEHHCDSACMDKLLAD